MIPINNSDTAWLIVSDFNQDNLIGYPDCLREDIYNPDVNDYYWEFTFTGVGGGGITVGVVFYSIINVGDRYNYLVGANGNVGDCGLEDYVGGNHP